MKLIISILIALISYNASAEERWPTYSCGNVVYQVGPLLLKWLQGGAASSEEIQVNWVAANPDTGRVYARDSVEKREFKNKVEFVVAQAKSNPNLKILTSQVFPMLGAASISLKSTDRKSVHDFICALPYYSIITNFKGEVILTRPRTTRF